MKLNVFFPSFITCMMLPMRDAATAMEVHITPNKIPERIKNLITITQAGFEGFL